MKPATTFKFFTFLLALIWTLPIFPHCYEVGFQVKDANLNLVSIPIEVYVRDGGTRIDNGNLNSGTSGYNFQIDLNDNCPPFPADCPVSCNIISLDVATEYVIVFKYPTGDKSLCFNREIFQCELGGYDAYYQVTPSTVTRVDGDYCDEIGTYPDCCVIYPLAMSLVISDTDYIGDKITYTLRATASGGNQSYTFSWSNATQLSAPSANPNSGRRTILKSQTVTVTCTVYSNGEYVVKQKVLRGDLDP